VRRRVDIGVRRYILVTRDPEAARLSGEDARRVVERLAADDLQWLVRALRAQSEPMSGRGLVAARVEALRLLTRGAFWVEGAPIRALRPRQDQAEEEIPLLHDGFREEPDDSAVEAEIEGESDGDFFEVEVDGEMDEPWVEAELDGEMDEDDVDGDIDGEMDEDDVDGDIDGEMDEDDVDGDIDGEMPLADVPGDLSDDVGVAATARDAGTSRSGAEGARVHAA
jgi:hypothetical protein